MIFRLQGVTALIGLFSIGASACASLPKPFHQQPQNLIAGTSRAIAYSGFREGQHPGRGNGAINPSNEQIKEDLKILVEHGFRLIRVYDSGDNSRSVLEVIRAHQMPIKVLLGIWLDAEVSNHEGCSWLTEPIPEAKLTENQTKNQLEVVRGIALAHEFSDIVVAVNVGNEALVSWNDHMVPIEAIMAYVRQVKGAIEQKVTVADNYLWWIENGAPLAAELDFIGVHTYPQWEEKSIGDALAYSIENIERVHAAIPGKPIAILEAGWASTGEEFGARASESNQTRYVNEMQRWAAESNTTLFVFEAFDEPWKGDPEKALGAEKHWGLFFVDRGPKEVMRPSCERAPNSE